MAAPDVQASWVELDSLKAAVITETELTSNNSYSSDDESVENACLIVASPYTDQEHRLDLSTLSGEVGSLAQALTTMEAVREDYATAPYHLAFNWDKIVSQYLESAAITENTAAQRFFVIVFRSRLKDGADRQVLGELDKAAHLEAIKAGGLLKYWFGLPDTNRRNLATCLWRARSDARLGGAGPGHAAAMIAARRMYDEWFVERLELTIDPQSGSWKFGRWPEAD